MTTINKILSTTKHRPFNLPDGKWTYYQEWNKAIFLHWKVPLNILRKMVPEKLNIDTFHGDAYISLVAFTMEKIRPKYLPAIKFISDFDEINIRTYVDNGNKKGVYFLNIEAGKLLSSLVAKSVSGLPYEKSTIIRSENTYNSKNKLKGFTLGIDYDTNELLTEKKELDFWLTERYCLYLDKGDNVYRYDIHHKEWEVKAVSINHLELDYTIGGLQLTNKPDLVHYSEGVKVVAWKRNKI